MARVLFHIDLNAFFASAEELRHPELIDKPLAVGSLSSRSVISTASYKAREYGVHSAMPVYQARELCPELTILPVDMAYYRQLSGEFFKILRQYSPMLEPASIDECYLDVTEQIRRYKRPLDLAVAIQQEVYEKLHLKCSIGVAPTRFLAKMASDMRKPMGITVLRKSDIPAKLWPQSIDKVVGIGQKTLPLLKKEGITQIGDLLDPEKENVVRRILGKNALSMLGKIQGRSSDVLSFSNTHKSVSVSRTYNDDVYTLDETLTRMRELVMRLCERLHKDGQKGQLVSVVFRNVEFRNKVRSKSLPFYTDQFEPIYQCVSNLVEENFEPEGYRHLGVSLGSLKDGEKIVMQPTIFEAQKDTADDVVQMLNRNFEANVFKKASDLLKEKKDE